MARLLRRVVSRSKRRYQLDGFDLDLAYIDCGPELDGRLLAMAFPSEGREAWYRNSYKEVRRFLQSRARQGGTYKVYNLTTELPKYEPEKLGGLLACFGFEDHQVPTIQQMHSFCEDVDEFLGLHAQNFAAVHCKAGKGRTGVMICAYLLHKGLAESAQAAMDIYARQRSYSSSGVTVPSQQRYIRYFEAVLRDRSLLESNPLVLESVAVSGLSSRQLAELVITVSQRNAAGELILSTELASSSAAVKSRAVTRRPHGGAVLELRPSTDSSSGSEAQQECILTGDVKIEVFRGRRLLFRTWLNTGFVSEGSYVLGDQQLDKGDSSVRPGMELRLQFAAPSSRSSIVTRLPRPEEVDIQEAHLRCLFPATSLKGMDSIPAISPHTSPQTVLSPSSAPSSPVAHILEVHPDFSIPTNICRLLTATPPTPPPSPPCSSASSRQLSRASSRSSCPDALAASHFAGPLDHFTTELPVSIVPERSGPRRTLSEPLAGNKGAVWQDLPTRSLSLVRIRADDWGEDPELHDMSAPATPSLPRPFNTFDWQGDAWARELTATAPADFHSQCHCAEGRPGSWSAFQEGSASGPDSPSHGARLIKWMSSSWWMDLA